LELLAFNTQTVCRPSSLILWLIKKNKKTSRLKHKAFRNYRAGRPNYGRILYETESGLTASVSRVSMSDSEKLNKQTHNKHTNY